MNATDAMLDQWEASHPDEVKQAAVTTYIESGDITPEIAGVSAEQIELVTASYAMFVEDKVAKPLGLTMAQWNSYIDPADLSEFRAMTVRGDWDGLRAHAREVAEHIRLHGDVNAE